MRAFHAPGKERGDPDAGVRVLGVHRCQHAAVGFLEVGKGSFGGHARHLAMVRALGRKLRRSGRRCRADLRVPRAPAVVVDADMHEDVIGGTPVGLQVLDALGRGADGEVAALHHAARPGRVGQELPVEVIDDLAPPGVVRRLHAGELKLLAFEEHAPTLRQDALEGADGVSVYGKQTCHAVITPLNRIDVNMVYASCAYGVKTQRKPTSQ